MADSGTIKWFSNAKGFGFIINDDGAQDIFVHYSSIVSEGYRTLKTGQIVNYDIKEGEKGLHAENVIPVGNNVKKNAIGNFDDDRLSGENNFCPNLSMIY